MPYIILKYITTESSGSHRIPVVMLDINDEVWEFEKEKEAHHIAEVLEQNSTTGKTYEVRKV
jgi:hypothetical protein